MKTLNFTAVEVLPSLLDKTKTQTIRCAWKNWFELIKDVKITESSKIPLPDRYIRSSDGVAYVEKPPRFKVGEKVKLVWNQGSKYKWFCDICGKGYMKRSWFNKEEIERTNTCCGDIYFTKLLGTAEIIEVFKIKIHKYIVQDNNEIPKEEYKAECYKLDEDLFDGEILAKRDGFKSAEEMFNWFDKKYDLSKPKDFWVYRWKWLDENNFIKKYINSIPVPNLTSSAIYKITTT